MLQHLSLVDGIGLLWVIEEGEIIFAVKSCGRRGEVMGGWDCPRVWAESRGSCPVRGGCSRSVTPSVKLCSIWIGKDVVFTVSVGVVVWIGEGGESSRGQAAVMSVVRPSGSRDGLCVDGRDLLARRDC